MMLRARHLTMASRFLAHRWQELHPYEVQALLLNACNLKCVYCRCPEIKTTLLTTEQWRGIIQRLGTLGTMRIKFQGGEPTLRTDLATIAAAAKKAGMVTAVTTNGFGIAERPSLLDHLDEVVISLDALTPALHDEHRGPGAHATALRALDLAVARGRKVYVNMVVHRGTAPELEAVLLYCERRGLRLNAQAVMFGCEYQDEKARFLGLSDVEQRAMYRQLAAWKRQGRPVLFSASTYERTAAWPDATTSTSSRTATCTLAACTPRTSRRRTRSATASRRPCSTRVATTARTARSPT
jgi:MoaA/NifB/PqqE/SkfB family radical SAM enzyme